MKNKLRSLERDWWDETLRECQEAAERERRLRSHVQPPETIGHPIEQANRGDNHHRRTVQSPLLQDILREV